MSNNIYANKINVSISERDAFITFSWIAPTLDSSDQVNGIETIEKQRIVMGKETARDLYRILGEILEQDTGNNG